MRGAGIQELLSCPSVVDVYTYKIDRLQQAVVRETPSFWRHLILKNDHFTQTGSGQTSGKHSKRDDACVFFLQDVDQVTEVLSFMWVSRAGVSAEELQGLVGMKSDDFERMHFALDGFLINRTGLLDFVDPMLREAVQVITKEENKTTNKRRAVYTT